MRRRSTTVSDGLRRTSIALGCSRGHRRSVYAITERGREVLAANPDRVDLERALPVPRVRGVQKASGTRRARPGAASLPRVHRAEAATPEERIEAAYQELREALIAEVRDRIAAMPPSAFEDLVLDVLHAMGYGDGTEHSGCGRAAAAMPGSTV